MKTESHENENRKCLLLSFVVLFSINVKGKVLPIWILLRLAIYFLASYIFLSPLSSAGKKM